jgi:hypothetical protein
MAAAGGVQNNNNTTTQLPVMFCWDDRTNDTLHSAYTPCPTDGTSHVVPGQMDYVPVLKDGYQIISTRTEFGESSRCFLKSYILSRDSIRIRD